MSGGSVQIRIAFATLALGIFNEPAKLLLRASLLFGSTYVATMLKTWIKIAHGAVPVLAPMVERVAQAAR